MKRQAAVVAATVVLAVAALFATTTSPAAASHEVEEGWISHGTMFEAVADNAPCTPEAVKEQMGEWGSFGPILCFPKPAGVTGWSLEHEWTGCTYYLVGWLFGDCLFTEDEGDYVKVWGAGGVFIVHFTLTWEHG